MLQTRNAKRTSAAENSELMEKHLLPRVMYSRNLFFFPFAKHLWFIYFIPYGPVPGKKLWRRRWTLFHKKMLSEPGAEVSSTLVRSCAARSWRQPRVHQALPAAPLLSQHSLCLHSLHMGTSAFFLLQALSRPKPLQALRSDIKGVNQVCETLILPE